MPARLAATANAFITHSPAARPSGATA
jgi:hypothetical protein